MIQAKRETGNRGMETADTMACLRCFGMRMRLDGPGDHGLTEETGCSPPEKKSPMPDKKRFQRLCLHGYGNIKFTNFIAKHTDFTQTKDIPIQRGISFFLSINVNKNQRPCYISKYRITKISRTVSGLRQETAVGNQKEQDTVRSSEEPFIAPILYGA